MRLAIVVLAALLASCSGAIGQIPADNLSWNLPTQRVDGTALPMTAIKETLIQWGSVSGGPYSDGSVRVAAPAASASVPRSGTGNRCYVAIAVLNSGLVSAASNEACKAIESPPKAPSDLVVS